MLTDVIGIKEIRETVAATADRLASTAEDTRTALVAVAVLGVVALAVALLAVGIGMRARHA